MSLTDMIHVVQYYSQVDYYSTTFTERHVVAQARSMQGTAVTRFIQINCHFQMSFPMWRDKRQLAPAYGDPLSF